MGNLLYDLTNKYAEVTTNAALDTRSALIPVEL
jgi:hypothetical protein